MFDVSENEGFELIKVGEYEAYVSEVTPPSNINGKMVSNLSYTIRDDVEQDFKGRTIKFDYFSDADNMKWKISSLAKALGFFENEATRKVVNGVKKLSFKSFESVYTFFPILSKAYTSDVFLSNMIKTFSNIPSLKFPGAATFDVMFLSFTNKPVFI